MWESMRHTPETWGVMIGGMVVGLAMFIAGLFIHRSAEQPLPPK